MVRVYLDVFYYPTSRRACMGRAKPLDKVIGITNRVVVRHDDGRYERLWWVFGESDSRVSLKDVFDACTAVGAVPLIVFRTMKGLHVYTDKLLRSCDRAYSYSRKLEKILGGNSYKAGNIRKKWWGYKFMVLRVGAKYRGVFDLHPIYVFYPSDKVLRELVRARLNLHDMMEAEYLGEVEDNRLQS